MIHEGRAQPALDAVSATLPRGSTTLVTGPSGAGKSTLADVLAGLVAPSAGALRIDEKALGRGDLRSWRRRVAYVQQEALLFDASVRDNLLWAHPGASLERLRDCLLAASAGFVFELPDALDTMVGDRGAQLSGGERQRIALARALLRDPELLILDEVTSALDSENELAVTQAISRLRGTITILMIGHKGALSTLADRTIALEAGRLVTVSDTTPLDQSRNGGN